MSRRDKEAGSEVPSRLEAMAVWRQALSQSNWLETCPIVELAVVEARGRVTAEIVRAARAAPHYEAAAMDGFAVRSEDTIPVNRGGTTRLKVLPAGQVLMPGAAVVVDTGDALPHGADCVIMNEEVVWIGRQIEIQTEAVSGQHVRKIGEDIMQSDIVLPAGRSISPADIGACLAAGNDRIKVLALPRVAVIPTGNEIVDSAAELPAGTIRDINSHMLAALFGGWGAAVSRSPVIPDDPDRLQTAIAAAVAANDLVVINAGTSEGTEDYSKKVLAGLGRICCHGVAIRPGRPVILAVVSGKPVVGLPGYPVSCMLTAELFLQDLLHEYQRKTSPKRQTVKARINRDIESRPGTEEFLRVIVKQEESQTTAIPLARGASLISTLTKADGLLRIGPELARLNAGDWVEVEVY
jgi:putative molybdopterin biosynthesis protein